MLALLSMKQMTHSYFDHHIYPVQPLPPKQILAYSKLTRLCNL